MAKKSRARSRRGYSSDSGKLIKTAVGAAGAMIILGAASKALNK